MSLFKRKRSAQDADQPADFLAGGDDPADQDGDSLTPAFGTPVVARPGGPFDVAEVDGPQGRLDVGALWLPLVEGLEIQLQMDEPAGQVTGAFLVLEGSAVQLQAFAAPRSEGIWTEIVDEIAAGITEQGGTADFGQGPFGRELLARVPTQQPDGKVGFQPLRFTGVDGPRWFLRAVFHGQAAVDPDAAAALEAVVRQVVVKRGTDPMGPRELLPLHLPVGVEGEMGGSAEAGPDHHGRASGTTRTQDDLRPFERGPEITERR